MFSDILVPPMLDSRLGRNELKPENVDGDVSKHFGRFEKDCSFGRDGAGDGWVGGYVDCIVGGG